MPSKLFMFQVLSNKKMPQQIFSSSRNGSFFYISSTQGPEPRWHGGFLTSLGYGGDWARGFGLWQLKLLLSLLPILLPVLLPFLLRVILYVLLPFLLLVLLPVLLHFLLPFLLPILLPV